MKASCEQNPGFARKYEECLRRGKIPARESRENRELPDRTSFRDFLFYPHLADAADIMQQGKNEFFTFPHERRHLVFRCMRNAITKNPFLLAFISGQLFLNL